MKNWQKWFVVVGGIVAVIGQFWGGPGMSPNIYLPLIGGVLALIGGLVK